MEHYTQSAARPYGSQPSSIPSQARLDVTQPEQQLPSIRDVIPPPRSTLVDSHTQEISSSARPIMVPYLSSQHTTNMNIASIPAPIQPQTTPIGFSTNGTGHMHMNNLAAGHLQTPTRTPAEYSSPWSSSSSFTDAGMPMSAQPSLSTQTTQFSLSQPILPSDPQESVYSSSYSIRQAESPVSDSCSRWRAPQVSSTHRYDPYSYGQTLDYGRFEQPYDRYQNPLTYAGGYRSMDAFPNHMKFNQILSYPMMGYPSHANGRRRRGNLPKQITDILRRWLQDNLDHPYPSDEQKQLFIRSTGLTISQISNWFINARRRQLPALKLKRAKAIQSRL